MKLRNPHLDKAGPGDGGCCYEAGVTFSEGNLTNDEGTPSTHHFYAHITSCFVIFCYFLLFIFLSWPGFLSFYLSALASLFGSVRLYLAFPYASSRSCP